MNAAIQKGLALLRKLRANEPVKLVLYPVIAIIVGSLVSSGVIDKSVEQYVLAAVALLIGLPLTSVIRANVTPVGKANDAIAAVAGRVDDALAQIDADEVSRISPAVRDALQRARDTAGYFRRGSHRA